MELEKPKSNINWLIYGHEFIDHVDIHKCAHHLKTGKPPTTIEMNIYTFTILKHTLNGFSRKIYDDMENEKNEVVGLSILLNHSILDGDYVLGG